MCVFVSERGIREPPHTLDNNYNILDRTRDALAGRWRAARAHRQSPIYRSNICAVCANERLALDSGSNEIPSQAIWPGGRTVHCVAYDAEVYLALSCEHTYKRRTPNTHTLKRHQTSACKVHIGLGNNRTRCGCSRRRAQILTVFRVAWSCYEGRIDKIIPFYNALILYQIHNNTFVTQYKSL